MIGKTIKATLLSKKRLQLSMNNAINVLEPTYRNLVQKHSLERITVDDVEYYQLYKIAKVWDGKPVTRNALKNKVEVKKTIVPYDLLFDWMYSRHISVSGNCNPKNELKKFIDEEGVLIGNEVRRQFPKYCFKCSKQEWMKHQLETPGCLERVVACSPIPKTKGNSLVRVDRIIKVNIPQIDVEPMSIRSRLLQLISSEVESRPPKGKTVVLQSPPADLTPPEIKKHKPQKGNAQKSAVDEGAEVRMGKEGLTPQYSAIVIVEEVVALNNSALDDLSSC